MKVEDNLNICMQQMLKDTRNLEKWTLESIQKYIEVSQYFNDQNQELNTSTNFKEINMQFLNFLDKIKLQKQHKSKKEIKNLTSFDQESQKAQITGDILRKKINREIILETLVKKLKLKFSCKGLQIIGSERLKYYSKIILTDLIASFKCLQYFKNFQFNDIQKVINTLLEKTYQNFQGNLKQNCSFDMDQLQEYLNNKLRNIIKDIQNSKKDEIQLMNRKSTIQIQVKNQQLKIQCLLMKQRSNQQTISKMTQSMNLEFVNILKEKGQIETQLSKLQMDLKLQQNQNQFELNSIEDQLEKNIQLQNDNKILKFWIVQKLKELLLNYLVDEKLLLKNKKNFIQIIQQIYDLKESVSKEDFGNYLNKYEIEFVLNYTKRLHRNKYKSKKYKIEDIDNKLLQIINKEKINSSIKKILQKIKRKKYTQNKNHLFMQKTSENISKNENLINIIGQKQPKKDIKEEFIETMYTQFQIDHNQGTFRCQRVLRMIFGDTESQRILKIFNQRSVNRNLNDQQMPYIYFQLNNFIK